MFKGTFLGNIDNPTIGLVYNSVIKLDNENDDGIVNKINF